MSNTDWEHKIRYTSDAVGKHEVQIDLLKRSDEARAQNLHDLDQRLKICEARSERVPALETSVNQVVPLKEDVQGLRAGFSEMQSLVDKLGQLHVRKYCRLRNVCIVLSLAIIALGGWTVWLSRHLADQLTENSKAVTDLMRKIEAAEKAVSEPDPEIPQHAQIILRDF